MTMNSSGPISLGGTTAGQSIELENGGPGTATISLNDTAVRNLAGIPATNTTIIMPTNFYGKSNRAVINLVISANTFNYDVYANASASPTYVAGKSDVTVTVNPGVVVGGNTTGQYAMLVPSSFNAADTVTIVNNGGYLQGAGGGGGTGYPTGGAGGTGGNSLYVNRPTSVNNIGFIYSGGGGGGGGGSGSYTTGSGKRSTSYSSGGGGGGGGAGYNVGAGGGGGSGSGGNGTAGSPGGTTTGGGGGAGATNAGPGGNGGASGAGGTAGPTGNATTGFPGGGTGYYIVGNAFVTWIATGTRAGNVA
jgi:hypothetical protein